MASMKSALLAITAYLIFGISLPVCSEEAWLQGASMLDRNDHWLRGKFTELGVIQFEDWADTGEEYEMFQLAEGEIAS